MPTFERYFADILMPQQHAKSDTDKDREVAEHSAIESAADALVCVAAVSRMCELRVVADCMLVTNADTYSCCLS